MTEPPAWFTPSGDPIPILVPGCCGFVVQRHYVSVLMALQCGGACRTPDTIKSWVSQLDTDAKRGSGIWFSSRNRSPFPDFLLIGFLGQEKWFTACRVYTVQLAMA